MDASKKVSLIKTQLALMSCTNSGLLDDLAVEAHPDEINRFCDLIDETIAAEHLQLSVACLASASPEKVNTKIVYNYCDVNGCKYSDTIILEGIPGVQDLVELTLENTALKPTNRLTRSSHWR